MQNITIEPLKLRFSPNKAFSFEIASTDPFTKTTTIQWALYYFDQTGKIHVILQDIVQFTPVDGKTRKITIAPKQITLPETVTEIEIVLIEGATPYSGEQIALAKLVVPVDQQDQSSQSAEELPKEQEQPSEAEGEVPQQEEAPIPPAAASQPAPAPVLPVVPITQAQDPVPSGKTDLTPADNTGNDVIDGSSQTDDVVINGGRGRDQITDGGGDDDIEGGLGRDIISLENGGADNVYYMVEFANIANPGDPGKVRATDGLDKITDFTLGEDSLIFRSKDDVADRDASAILTVLHSGKVVAHITTAIVEVNGVNETHAKGITFTFPLSGKTATGRSTGRKLIIEFDETELLSDFVATLGGASAYDAKSLKITNLTSLSSVFGTDNLRYESAVVKGDDTTTTTHGTAQRQVIYKSANDDTVYGNEGDDIIHSGTGENTLFGGTGYDILTYITSLSGITIDLADNANNKGDAKGDSYDGFEEYIATQYADSFISSDGADIFRAGRGIDQADGGDGQDWLYGDEGNDFLYGGQGTDRLYGGADDDHLYGGTDNDKLYGGEGEDALYGNGGDDKLYGGKSRDYLYGNAGADSLYGGAGDDILDGGADEATDKLYGGSGFDLLYAYQNDHLDGGSGQDTISFVRWSQFVKPDNTLAPDDPRTIEVSAYVIVDLVKGQTQFYSIEATATPNFINGRPLHVGDATFKNIEHVIGSDGNDTITGDFENNVIEGGAGADTLDGGHGNDTLSYASSSAGVTVSLSRYYNDIYEDGYKILSASAGGDAAGDRIKAFENLIGSAHDDTLEGNGYAQSIKGGAGDDRLFGLAGADRLYGGTGYNILDGGSGNDFYDGGPTAPRSASFIAGNYSAISFGSSSFALDDLDLRNAQSVIGTTDHYQITISFTKGAAQIETYRHIQAWIGTNHDDVITGSSKDEAIGGGLGNDKLDGGAGTDYYSLRYFEQGLTITVGNSTNADGYYLVTLTYKDGTIKTDQVKNFEVLQGTDHDDVFWANTIITIMDGAGGNDQFDSATADGTFHGGAGIDQLNYRSASSGIVFTLSPYQDIAFDNSGNRIALPDLSAYRTAFATHADGVTKWVTDLVATRGLTNESSRDSYTSIEMFLGTKKGDVFIASLGGAIIDAGQNNDNKDDVISYHLSLSGITLDLQQLDEDGYFTQSPVPSDYDPLERTTWPSFEKGDRLIGFESYIGSDYNDEII